jgi:hypothetical protein
MAFCDFKIMDCGLMRPQIIRDELVWDKAIFLQQLAHEFQRRSLVPPALDQPVEDLAPGVDGSPKIDHAAIDFQIDFVQMPSRMGLGLGRRLQRSAAILVPKWFTQRRTVS